MKNLSRIIPIFCLITFWGCEKQVANPVTNSTDLFASFSVEGTQIAPARLIFTNHSQNGKQFHWDFGNGIETDFYQPSPVSYPSSGLFTVTLFVMDTATARSDTASAILNIALGGPYLYGMNLQTI